MSAYTTFRVGGPAEALCEVPDLLTLQQVTAFLGAEGVAYLAAGWGGNLLVSDEGLKGVVIVLRGELAQVRRLAGAENRISAGGGLGIPDLLSFCRRQGLGGLEFLAGIPGTVGGAVAMNAGAFGGSIGERVAAVKLVDGTGALTCREGSALHFGYRGFEVPSGGSSPGRGQIIVEAQLHLEREERVAIARRMRGYLAKRRQRQPLEHPSAGSVFKNPAGDHAGRLIERAGLKGHRIGGAMISTKHANFIVNTGDARAADILRLMDLVRQRVREQSGIELEPEIRMVGFFGQGGAAGESG